MSTVLSIAFPLVMLALVLRLLLRSPMGATEFNARRASLAIRSRTGGNAVLALAAVNLAQLAVQLAAFTANDAADRIPGRIGPWIVVALLIAFVFSLVAADRQAGFLLSVAGIAAGVLSTALDFGWASVAVMLILAMLLVWILGLARGVLRPLG